MLKRVIILLLGMFMLSGCIDGFRNYFSRSANNKLIDSSGFKGGKRKPLYNGKYITLAKKNIVEDNLDDEDNDDVDSDNPLSTERIDPAKRNREMYLKMIKKDVERYKAREGKGRDGELTLSEASKKAIKSDKNKENELRQEMAQLKEMIKETRRDISKYTCPGATQQPPNYSPPVNNYEPVKDSIRSYNTKSKVKQKFITEDADNSGCAI